MRPRVSLQREDGFTLLEVLVALFIISILLGMSLGMLSRMGRKEGLEATTAGARALLRRARNAAQEERWPTLVEVDAKASELRAQTRSTITHFRFDGVAAAPAAGDDDAAADRAPASFVVPGALGYQMTVDGGEVVLGHVGQGLLFERPGAWAWVEDRPALSPAEGVFVELMLYLGDLSETLDDRAARPTEAQERAAERAGERPRAPSPRVVDWRWRRRTADLAAALHGRAQGAPGHRRHGRPRAGAVALHRPRARPRPRGHVHRPHASGHAQGRALVPRGPALRRQAQPRRRRRDPARAPAAHGHDALPEALARDRSPLTLSDPHPDAGFYGVIDELKVAAVLASQRLEVPQDVLLIAPEDAVGFDLLGQLDTSRHAEPIVIYLTDDERAWDLLAGTPTPEGGGTRTRAEQEARQRAAAGATPYARFVAGSGPLDPPRGRAVVVERPGMVR
ncbi:MAG: type II secretion system protein [Planctomycetota bacterium]|nr:type II secretion system protein [Planctomycetota bacterium]